MRFDAAAHKRLIPAALKRARQEASLTIDEAAAESGINPLTIQNHEWGTNLPSMDYFILELQTYGLDFGRFHELLVEIYADLRHEEVSGELDKLKERLACIEVSSCRVAK
ncbi:MAG: helix-turn-helix transcriptional regulator [Pirellulales bacterium]|nr:helix-turn-helix transcriptional regulator [Pirellulales bacterium]